MTIGFKDLFKVLLYVLEKNWLKLFVVFFAIEALYVTLIKNILTRFSTLSDMQALMDATIDMSSKDGSRYIMDNFNIIVEFMLVFGFIAIISIIISYISMILALDITDKEIKIKKILKKFINYKLYLAILLYLISLFVFAIMGYMLLVVITLILTIVPILSFIVFLALIFGALIVYYLFDYYTFITYTATYYSISENEGYFKQLKFWFTQVKPIYYRDLFFKKFLFVWIFGVIIKTLVFIPYIGMILVPTFKLLFVCVIFAIYIKNCKVIYLRSKNANS